MRRLFMKFYTSNGCQLKFYSLISQILTFYPIEKFALRTQRRNFSRLNGVLFPADMATKHKKRSFITFNLASCET